MADSELKRGTGGDPNNPPLPQGMAGDLAAALLAAQNLGDDEVLLVDEEEMLEDEEGEEEEIPEEDEELIDEDEDMSDIEFADDADEEDLAAPKDEVSQYLYAPGTGIGPSLTGNPRRAGPVPRSVIRRIPILGAAASSPDAPPMIRALYRLIVDVARQDQDV